MPTLEQQIQQQIEGEYAKVFEEKDWRLFKDIAEYYLRSAAYLKKKDIKHNKYHKLIRNATKRLYIGIACELLLKAFYLNRGYVINTLIKGRSVAAHSPYKFTEVNPNDLDQCNTRKMHDLIQELHKVHRFVNHGIVVTGFTIARAFRNKEGHITSLRHAYNQKDYADIEQALTEFYREAFNEKLTIQISVELKEKANFKVEPLQ